MGVFPPPPIDNIKEKPTIKTVNTYNSKVLGLQNYFKIATMVSQDFGEIAYKVRKHLNNKTKRIRANPKIKENVNNKSYQKFFKEYNFKIISVARTILYPIGAIKWKNCMQYSQEISRYTPQGREKLHEKLKLDMDKITYIMRNPVKNETVEYNDNRISLYAGQQGRCAISNQYLEIGWMEVHHIIPKILEGDDNYSNLIFVTSEIHTLIHATVNKTIAKYLKKVELDDLGFEKLNKFRTLVGNSKIDKSFIIDGKPYEVKVSSTA